MDRPITFWDYFRSPFPKAEGFSAYRSPGLLVHLPVIGFFLWLGAWLTLGDPWLYILFPLFVLMGVYLGRDAAILAHYNCIIPLLVVGGGLYLLNHPSLPRHLAPILSAGLSGALAVLFIIYVSFYRDMGRGETPGLGGVLRRLIDRIDHAGARPEDPEPVRLRKALLIFLGASGMMIAPWGARHLAALGLPLASRMALGHAALSLLALTILLATKREALPAWLLLLGMLATPALLQIQMGGFAASGGLVSWSLLAPLCALVFLGTRAALVWFGAFVAAVFAVAIEDQGDAHAVLRFCENTLLVSAVAFIAVRFFIQERDRAEAALAREQARSEALLLNILPASIAERLKGEHKPMADGYAEASILFADLVGFTKLSSTMPPEQLVALLNGLFTRFDLLCDGHRVEKIKTIGDAYMVCAGLPDPRPDHARALVRLALDMQAALADHNREHASDLVLRIGINSGPVVAGVIGLKKFIYDLWGDTVNLASRLESSGVPGRIQVSAATAERLKDDFDFEARGPLELKGLGATETFLLVGPKP